LLFTKSGKNFAFRDVRILQQKICPFDVLLYASPESPNLANPNLATAATAAAAAMSRRYNSRTTIFSPEGRLYQVEYAMEAIALGILAADGVVLVGEKKVTSKLLQTSRSAEKMYKIDSHLACAIAGIMSDANILINTACLHAQRVTVCVFVMLDIFC
jgi:hypothetical protein